MYNYYTKIMGRRFQFNITPEHLEELYTTEMNEEERSLWSSCLDFIVKHFGCSRQLADIRIRDWLREYPHDLFKVHGGHRFYNKNVDMIMGSKCYRCKYYIRCKEYEENAESLPVTIATKTGTDNKYDKKNNYDKIIIQEKQYEIRL